MRNSIKQEIVVYLEEVLNEGKQQGFRHVEVVSGDIHKELNYKNRMPSVCHAMRSILIAEDEIIRTTPSGNSSTITIRYSTNR